MREIKFRAWDKPHKKMIADYCSKDIFVAFGFWSPDRFDYEQFTGLKDKNEVEIYEGDIVKAGPDTMQVVWSERHASIGLGKAEWAFMHFFGEAVEARRCQVIGNIHQNPELLK